MQFCGFVLWKHLCKQANHIAAILNQKSCDLALIKILAGIIMWLPCDLCKIRSFLKQSTDMP